MQKIIDRALIDIDNGLGQYKKTIKDDAKELAIRLSGGDARILLNAVEIAVTSYKEKSITLKIIKDIFRQNQQGFMIKRQKNITI